MDLLSIMGEPGKDTESWACAKLVDPQEIKDMEKILYMAKKNCE